MISVILSYDGMAQKKKDATLEKVAQKFEGEKLGSSYLMKENQRELKFQFSTEELATNFMKFLDSINWIDEIDVPL